VVAFHRCSRGVATFRRRCYICCYTGARRGAFSGLGEKTGPQNWQRRFVSGMRIRESPSTYLTIHPIIAWRRRASS